MSRKFWKILVWTSVLLVGGFVALCLLFFLALPSPHQIKKKTFAQFSSPQAKAKLVNAVATQQNEEAPDSTGNDVTSASAPTHSSADSEIKSKNWEQFEKLSDSNSPLSTTCRSLSRIQNKQMGKMNSQEFADRFDKSLSGDTDDPLFESIEPFLKFTLRQPGMIDVISMIKGAEDRSQLDSIVAKTEFYYAIYSAYQEMTKNKNRMQNILDQSYLTMMLGRAIEKNPSLANDSRVYDYCEAIESHMSSEEPIDFTEEKKAFLDFLGQSAINPTEIGFDPNYQSNLDIVFNKKGLHVKGAWVDEIFSSLYTKPPNQ